MHAGHLLACSPVPAHLLHVPGDGPGTLQDKAWVPSSRRPGLLPTPSDSALHAGWGIGSGFACPLTQTMSSEGWQGLGSPGRDQPDPSGQCPVLGHPQGERSIRCYETGNTGSVSLAVPMTRSPTWLARNDVDIHFII